MHYNPQPTPANIITHGQARFVLLSPRMLRLEWSAAGAFEDRATLAVVHRALPAVPHSCAVTGKRLTLSTSAFTLSYTDDGQPFSAENLLVSFTLNGETVAWAPGLPDTQNLGATRGSLDRVKGGKYPVEVGIDKKTGKMKHRWTPVDLGMGFISRSGWACVDDSSNVLLSEDQGKVLPRGADLTQDWYLLLHGHDYRGALADAAQVFGRQPLPPRFAFGYWWSRYWAYSDRELEGLARQFDSYQVPLDVMVVDMDWHLEGWGGYTWDRRYFPDPAEFLRGMQRREVKISLNLHPGEGVANHEAPFPAMAAALGLNPAKAERVPFDIIDPTYMDAYFRLLHHPQEAQGVDFWWMDAEWPHPALPGLNMTAWINHLHWRDMERNPRRNGKRPLIFSRFGGIGAGRYCIGFSGDTVSVWDSLQFQPYFTATAANVLYGYWSHDIGGFAPGAIEPELYTRWVQFGVHAPILRTHCAKNPTAERRVWEYPSPYRDIMMEAIRLRYEMAPYIYTEARGAHDTGCSLCRPLYYDYPEEEAAYTAKDQYAFGSQLLLAPVLTPVSPRDEMAAVTLWLPEGRWFDTARGCMEAGGGAITRRYLLSEVPAFVRPGTILPGQGQTLRLREGSYPSLILTAYPGGDGAYRLYEDDGISEDYQHGGCAWIPLSQHSSGNLRLVTIHPAEGGFPGFLAQRPVEIRLPASTPPLAVRAGEVELEWAYQLGTCGWTYDGDTATTIIRLPSVELTRGLTVTVELNPELPEALATGVKGALARLVRVCYYNTLATTCLILHPEERLGIDAAQTGNRISRDPSTFAAELARLQQTITRLPRMLAKLGVAIDPWGPGQPDPQRKEYCATATRILKRMQQEGLGLGD